MDELCTIKSSESDRKTLLDYQAMYDAGSIKREALIGSNVGFDSVSDLLQAI